MQLITENTQFSNQIETFGQSEFIAAAFSQLTSESLLLDNGARRFEAIDKALKNIDENDSIKFENGVLSFVSMKSGEPRRVTKSGCVASACPCGNGISYHRALFDILSRAERLREEKESFGSIVPVTATELEEMERETKRAGLEFKIFCNELPLWVSEDKHFDLWLMSEKERENYLEKNSPYLKTKPNKQVEKCGSIRI